MCIRHFTYLFLPSFCYWSSYCGELTNLCCLFKNFLCIRKGRSYVALNATSPLSFCLKCPGKISSSKRHVTIKSLFRMHVIASCESILSMPLSKIHVIKKEAFSFWGSIVLTGVERSRKIMKAKCYF